MRAQGVSEVVQVVDLLGVEFDQNVAGFEPGFSGRAGVAHIGKLHPTVLDLAEVGNGAEVGSVSAAPAGGGTGRLSHAHVLRFVIQHIQSADHVRHQLHDTYAARGINLVPSV